MAERTPKRHPSSAAITSFLAALTAILVAGEGWALSLTIDPNEVAKLRVTLVAIDPGQGLQDQVTQIPQVGLFGAATITQLPSAQVVVNAFSLGWDPETVNFVLPTIGTSPTLVLDGYYEWADICCISPNSGGRRATGNAAAVSLGGSLDVSGTALPFSFDLSDYTGSSLLQEGSARDNPAFFTDLNILEIGEAAKQLFPQDEFAALIGTVGGVDYWLHVTPFADTAPLTYAALPEAAESIQILLVTLGVAWKRRRSNTVAAEFGPSKTLAAKAAS